MRTTAKKNIIWVHCNKIVSQFYFGFSMSHLHWQTHRMGPHCFNNLCTFYQKRKWHMYGNEELLASNGYSPGPSRNDRHCCEATPSTVVGSKSQWRASSFRQSYRRLNTTWWAWAWTKHGWQKPVWHQTNDCEQQVVDRRWSDVGPKLVPSCISLNYTPGSLLE